MRVCINTIPPPSPGTLDFPNSADGAYGPDLKCGWLLTNNNADSSCADPRVAVEFIFFQTENIFDSVTLSNGASNSQLGQFSGWDLPGASRHC